MVSFKVQIWNTLGLSQPSLKAECENMNFNFEQRSGNDVIEFNRFNYSIGDRELFKNANLFIRYKEKVCIMGKNGTGKSTLIKQILNKNENIRLGSRIKIGYIEQDITFEDENLEVIQEARKYFIGSEENLRSALVRFLFYSEGVSHCESLFQHPFRFHKLCRGISHLPPKPVFCLGICHKRPCADNFMDTRQY